MAGFPRRIGPYRVEGVLGRGTVAEVYRARRGVEGTPRALKVLRRGASQAIVKRFRREADRAREFDHPNLAHAVDADLTANPPWYAMELADGDTLERLVAADRSRVLRILPKITVGLLDALGALAERDLAHRDIAPANILVTDRGVARLVDLGLLDKPGSGLVGTPAYMAPEELRGEHLGTASDLYEVGAVIYEVLSGMVPHEDMGSNLLELRRTPGLRATELDSMCPGVSASVARLVSSMIDPDPEARPLLAQARERAAAIPAPWLHRPPVAQAFDNLAEVGPRRSFRKRTTRPVPVPEARPALTRRDWRRVLAVLALAFVVALVLLVRSL